MTISVTCECGEEYRLSDDKAGKQFECRVCETRLRVPKPGRLDEAPHNHSDGEPDPETDEEVAPRRPKSKSDAAKKRGQKKTNLNAGSSARRKMIGFGVGLGIGIALLVWFSIAQGLLIPILSALTFLLTIGLPFAKDYYFRRRIREEIESYGGKIESISWRPFQGAFFTRGWHRSKSSRYYTVQYTNRAGQSQTDLCAMSFWGGSVWGDDIDDKWGAYNGGMDVELIAYRLAPVLLLLGGWAAGIESVYALWGESTTGTVTQVTEQTVQSRRTRNSYRGSKRYLYVHYSYTATDGTARQGSSRMKITLLVPDIQKGSPVIVEYLPGRSGWARLESESYKAWLKIAAWFIGIVSVVLVGIQCLDYFDVFQLHSRKRKSKSD